jgi:hypothetical protein
MDEQAYGIGVRMALTAALRLHGVQNEPFVGAPWTSQEIGLWKERMQRVYR